MLHAVFCGPVKNQNVFTYLCLGILLWGLTEIGTCYVHPYFVPHLWCIQCLWYPTSNVRVGLLLSAGILNVGEAGVWTIHNKCGSEVGSAHSVLFLALKSDLLYAQKFRGAFHKALTKMISVPFFFYWGKDQRQLQRAKHRHQFLKMICSDVLKIKHFPLLLTIPFIVWIGVPPLDVLTAAGPALWRHWTRGQGRPWWPHLKCRFCNPGLCSDLLCWGSSRIRAECSQ